MSRHLLFLSKILWLIFLSCLEIPIVNLDRCFEKFSILERRSKGIEERSFISFLVVEYRVFNWTREEEEKEDSAKMTIIINNK